MKKIKTVGLKRIELALARETVAILSGGLLKHVGGGLLPQTLHSQCVTRCIDC